MELNAISCPAAFSFVMTVDSSRHQDTESKAAGSLPEEVEQIPGFEPDVGDHKPIEFETTRANGTRGRFFKVKGTFLWTWESKDL